MHVILGSIDLATHQQVELLNESQLSLVKKRKFDLYRKTIWTEYTWIYKLSLTSNTLLIPHLPQNSCGPVTDELKKWKLIFEAEMFYRLQIDISAPPEKNACS